MTPLIPYEDLDDAYREMAADVDGEREAERWIEGLVGRLDRVV